MMKSISDVEAPPAPPTTATVAAATAINGQQKPSNGHAHGHGTPTQQQQQQQHSNGNGNGNGHSYHQNGGGRRDSTQAFTPLLAQHNSTNGDVGTATPTTPTTVLYESAPSNNNEWKASEDINNLKNGLLSNNNGNGHNGHNGHSGHNLREKYAHEQAPLTGG